MSSRKDRTIYAARMTVASVVLQRPKGRAPRKDRSKTVFTCQRVTDCDVDALRGLAEAVRVQVARRYNYFKEPSRDGAGYFSVLLKGPRQYA